MSIYAFIGMDRNFEDQHPLFAMKKKYIQFSSDEFLNAVEDVRNHVAGNRNINLRRTESQPHNSGASIMPKLENQ